MVIVYAVKLLDTFVLINKINNVFIDICSCWLSEVQGTIWAFVAPMLLIILVSR